MRWTKLSERSPEAKAAYLQGYQAGIRHAAELAEREKSPLAKRLWEFMGLAEIVNADGVAGQGASATEEGK